MLAFLVSTEIPLRVYKLTITSISTSINVMHMYGKLNNRLSCRRGTARRTQSVEILSNAANLYEKGQLTVVKMANFN